MAQGTNNVLSLLNYKAQVPVLHVDITVVFPLVVD